MEKREFVFEIKEIKTKRNHRMPNDVEQYLFTTTGTAVIDEDEIRVMVDDKKQPYGMFEAKDSFFKRIIKKIHEATK